MATHNSSGVQRRRIRLDGNRPRTHPKRSGRKATKPGPAPADSCDCPDGDCDPLFRLSRAIALVETIAVAMQTREADVELGPIAVCLDLATCQFGTLTVRSIWRLAG
jgi:hypothetical protein